MKLKCESCNILSTEGVWDFLGWLFFAECWLFNFSVLFFSKLFKGKFLTRNTMSSASDAAESYSQSDIEKLACAARYLSTDMPEVGYLRPLLVTLKSVSYFLSNTELIQAPHSREKKHISAKIFKSCTFINSPRIHSIYD